jgi:hypothetical protein
VSARHPRTTRPHHRMPILAVAAALCTLLPISTSIASAAKGSAHGKPGGSGGGTSSLSLVMLTDKNSDGLPNWGDTVTFNVSTTATTQPWVNLNCYRSGTLVFQSWMGFFDGSISYRYVTLSSGAWTGGAADCTAWLDNAQLAHLTSISFHVNA